MRGASTASCGAMPWSMTLSAVCSVMLMMREPPGVPITRSLSGPNTKVGVIDDTVKKCQEGGTLLLFPEGTREKEGKFLPLKSGLFVIAAAANVDVVPCRIYYDTPDGKMKLFCKVRVIFGEPMPAAQFAMEGRRDIKKLRENKQAVLDAWSEL